MSKSSSRVPSVEELLRAHRRHLLDDNSVLSGIYLKMVHSCRNCAAVAPLAERRTLTGPAQKELECLTATVSSGGWDAALVLVADGGKDAYIDPGLARCLIEESRKALFRDPTLSRRWAELAAAVAGKSEEKRGPSRERLAQALAYQGNAVRIIQTNGLSSAEPWFTTAYSLLRTSGVRWCGDVAADLDWLEGSLRKDQRHFDEAVLLLRRSVATSILLDDPDRITRTILSLAHTHYFAGDFSAALEIGRFGHASSIEQGDPDMRFLATVNLTVYSEASGDLRTAKTLFREVGRLSEGRNLSKDVKVRLAAQEARLDAAEGLEEAFCHLWAIYRYWLDVSKPYDAVAHLLEIGRIAQLIDRVAELPRVVAEISRLLDATPEFGEELRQALSDLAGEVRQRSVTPVAYVAFCQYLGVVQRNPTLVFNPRQAT